MAKLAIQYLYCTDDTGSLSAEARAFRIGGSEFGAVTRSIGLGGDPVTVEINAQDIPEDWDLAGGSYTIQIGDDDNYVLLDGYRARRLLYHDHAQATDPGAMVPWSLSIELGTIPAIMRDGRGPLIRYDEGILNPLKADGTVDDTDDAYRTNGELAELLLDALCVETGLTHTITPAGLDTSIDGATAIDPPGPLDFGNADALTELESLLRRLGWAAALDLEGQNLRLVRLLRGGETITVDPALAASLEPYTLTSQRSIRGATIVITSGSTRTTIVRELTLADMEWVGFDDRTGTWMNGTEWAAAYAGEIKPGDIAAYQAGPTTDHDDNDQRKRLFSALRIADPALRRRASAFVAIAAPVSVTGGPGGFAGKMGFVAGQGCVSAQNQFANWPETDTMVRIDDAQFIAGHGVVKLPPRLHWVRMDGGSGTYQNALEIADDKLTIVVAHESRENDPDIDFFTSVWEVTNTAGVLSVDRVTDEGEIAAAIASRQTIKVHQPDLRRVMEWPDGDTEPTALNDTELHAIAEQIALMRASDERVEAGIVPVRGFHEIAPGDWGGAGTSVRWDVGAGLTLVSVNTHETPGGRFDAMTRAAGESVGAGLGRLALAGTWVTQGEVRATPSPSGAMAGLGGVGGGAAGISGMVVAASAVAMRGRERAIPMTTSGATGAGTSIERGIGSDAVSRVWGVITGATSIGTNRWKYSWSPIRFVGDSYEIPEGAPDQSTLGYALNTLEFGNDGSGVEGNDIDYTDDVGTYELKAIGRGTDERVFEMCGPHGIGEDRYWHFTAVNADDGACE